jgi:serine/threonine protein kinase
MSSKRTLNSRYEIYGVIGVGNYGRVFEGFDTLTRSKVAIKELFPEVVRNPELMRITNMEIETLTKITHKYIIKLHDHFPIANVYYLVYDYCEKGDLKANVDRQGRFREYDALKIVYQMSEALCELKRHLIIHRDIKPENIFLTNDLCKLGDFGLCFKGDRVQLNASVGSLGFLAPETQMMLIYSSKADVYSLGICYYEMIHGDIPFTQAQIEDLYNVKMRLRIDRIPGIDISDFALNLMRRMVEPDEAKRIDCQEIRDILAPLYPEYQISPSQTGGIHQIRRVGENSERLSTQPDSTQPVSGMLQSNSLNNSYSQPATLYGVQLQQTQQYQLPSQIPASNNLYTAADHISSPFPNINLNGNSYDSSSNPVVAPAIVPQRVQPPTQIQPAPSLIGSRSMQSYKEYNRAPVYKSLIGDSPLKNRLTSISKNINNASFERESSVPRTFGTTFGRIFVNQAIW